MTSGTIDADRAPGGARDGFRLRIEGSVIGDRIYGILVTVFALCVPALLILIAIEIFVAGWPALHKFGFSFLTSSAWDPVNGQFRRRAGDLRDARLFGHRARLIATPLAIGVADLPVGVRAGHGSDSRSPFSSTSWPPSRAWSTVSGASSCCFPCCEQR